MDLNEMSFADMMEMPEEKRKLVLWLGALGIGNLIQLLVQAPFEQLQYLLDHEMIEHPEQYEDLALLEEALQLCRRFKEEAETTKAYQIIGGATSTS